MLWRADAFMRFNIAGGTSWFRRSSLDTELRSWRVRMVIADPERTGRSERRLVSPVADRSAPTLQGGAAVWYGVNWSG
jgi:hypothetical protein